MSSSPSITSPSLAWEVVERIIDHLQDEVKALRCCALTCRHLRPRTRLHLLARIRVDRNDQLEDLIGLFDAGPHLRSLVRSVSISLADIVPHPLLILPNLSHWKFVSHALWDYRPMIFHPWTLLCCQFFGTHVQTLSFDRVYFVNCMALVRIISAFPNIRFISCRFIEVRAMGAHSPLELVKERLIKQTQVTKLSMGRDIDAMAFGLLLEVVHKTVQHLDITISKPLVVASGEAIIRALHELQFPHLRSLIVHLPRKRHNTLHALLRCTIELLKNCTTLQEVDVEFSCHRGLHLLSSWLMKESHASLCRELETLMLQFALPAISFSSPQAIRESRRIFWAGEFGWYFPTLHRRGQIKILSKTTEGPHTHDAAVSILAFSPDSKWLASGSADSTIILWDAERPGQPPAHEWVAHVGGVDRLAFSPSDGRFLASSGKDNAVTLWAVGAHGQNQDQDQDQGRDIKCVTCLREVERMWRVELCGWAGSSLLFTSSTKTKAVVRTWDTATATQRQLLAARSVHVVPSPSRDGPFRVLSSSTPPQAARDGDGGGGAASTRIRVREIDADMSVRDVTFLACDGRAGSSPPKDASCSPGGLLATIHGDAHVLIWDLEVDRSDAPTGAPARPPARELAHPAGKVKGIAVAPDGSRVLAWAGNTLTIWDGFADPPVPGGRGVSFDFDFEGHGDLVTAATFSPEGKHVASASKDGAMWLWSASTSACVASFSEHAAGVACVGFSPDGKVLSSGDANGTVVIRLLRDVVPEGLELQ